jgi:hypothetical protein
MTESCCTTCTNRDAPGPDGEESFCYALLISLDEDCPVRCTAYAAALVQNDEFRKVSGVIIDGVPMIQMRKAMTLSPIKSSALKIGLQLPIEARPFYLVALLEFPELGPLGDICEALGIPETTPALLNFAGILDALFRGDDSEGERLSATMDNHVDDMIAAMVAYSQFGHEFDRILGKEKVQ